MIVGISGQIGAGKDELAKILQQFDNSYEVRKYAAKLKQIAAILTGYKDQYTQEGKNTFMPEWGMTVGEFQQKLGTEAIREGIHPNAWIIALFADYHSQMSNWLITDVRFPNEAQAVLDRGGLLVRIDGTRLKDIKRDVSHPSETALNDWTQWDYRFNNATLNYNELIHHADMIHHMAKFHRNVYLPSQI